MNTLTLATLLKDDPAARVLDVRTPSEFENAHISGAYNVPLDQLHEHAHEVRAAASCDTESIVRQFLDHERTA